MLVLHDPAVYILLSCCLIDSSTYGVCGPASLNKLSPYPCGKNTAHSIYPPIGIQTLKQNYLLLNGTGIGRGIMAAHATVSKAEVRVCFDVRHLHECLLRWPTLPALVLRGEAWVCMLYCNVTRPLSLFLQPTSRSTFVDIWKQCVSLNT